MQELPEPVYTSAQIRTLEAAACKRAGIALYALMERAGAAAAFELRAWFPHARTVAVMIGPGNNGGDGWVLARLLRERGMHVQAYCTVGVVELKGDAAIAAAAFLIAGGAVAEGAVGRADVYVDALLGIGARAGLSGRMAELAAAMEPKLTLALDLPSGLCADTGFAWPGAVRARYTVCFVGAKLGLLTGSGPDLAGEVRLAELGLAELLDVPENLARRVSARAFAGALPPRARAAHKGHFGHVLAIGGDNGMAGAIRLSTEAALRAGAGLVTAATRASSAAAIEIALPEAMTRVVDDPAALVLSGYTVLLGPGLGQGAWAQALFARVLAHAEPMVLDADGLNLQSTCKSAIPAGSVLTPHPGEAARLLEVTVVEVERDRPAAVRALARRFGCVVILKGAGSLIADPAGALWICDRGNPGMATGGMGDVLAGVIAAFLAQGMSATDAARFGVYAHAAAGDLAARAGERGLSPRDLLAQLRAVVNPHALA